MANGQGQVESVRSKEIVLGVMMLLVTSVFGWVLSETIDTYGFKERGNRFTTVDGQNLFSDIRAEMDQNYPPKWLVNDLDHIRKEMEEVRLEDRRLQVQIQALDCRDLGDYYVPPSSSVDPEMFNNAGG